MSNDCQFRLDSRIRVALPVRVTYRDRHLSTRTEDACACDVSRLGARLVGLSSLPNVGDEIEIQYGGKRAPFRVMWELDGHVGTLCVEDTAIWDTVGPLAVLQPSPYPATPPQALRVKVVSPSQYLEHLHQIPGDGEHESTVLVCLDPEKPTSIRALAPPRHQMAASAAKKVEEFISSRLSAQNEHGESLPNGQVTHEQFFLDLLSQSTTWQHAGVQDDRNYEQANRDTVHGVTRGIGVLKSADERSQTYKVEFMFEIVTELISRAGDRWASSKVSGSGKVRSLGGRNLPQGEYELETSDGEVLHIKNSPAGWTILPD